MATRAYDSTAEGLAFDTAINCFEIRNPAGSGKLLSASTFVAEVGFTEWLFKRYTGAATTGGAATAVAVHKADTRCQLSHADLLSDCGRYRRKRARFCAITCR